VLVATGLGATGAYAARAERARSDYKDRAAIYILAGAGALLIASALPSTHPLSAVFAIMVGVPCTLLL
jgi:hypothetical protein